MTARDSDDIIKEAKKRWERAYERERENIEEAREALAFRTGGPQWPEEMKRNRELEGRPCLEFNQMGKFVRQVTGDIRQMKPGIKIVPVDDNGDPETALKIAGLVRHIETRSDAQAAYFQGADSQVTAGIGHWRVITEYAGDESLDQDIRIMGIEDGVSVLWDPDSSMPSREDANFCFVPVDYSQDLFKEKWPDAQIEGLPGDDHKAWQGWFGEDYVRVAEYWVKKPVPPKFLAAFNGQTEDVTDQSDEARAALASIGVRVEKRETKKVCRYLISGHEVLEGPEDWKGRLIPIVPCLGEEVRIGRRVVRRGIIHDVMDSQRVYNYSRSTQTEVVSLQPKAPFIGTEKNFEKYEAEWQSANNKALPFLPYTPDPLNSGQPPQRSQPPVGSSGLSEAVALALEDMKSITGIFDASLGSRSNETSGKAILARQQEGDTGTFHYVDNFARAIRHTGRILVDLIPHIYDTARTFRIIGEDGKPDEIKINQPNSDGLLDQPMFDVTVGQYDVVVEMGPSYNTRRAEARDGMTSFIQASPEMAPLVADLYAKAQDWPMADQIAKRMKTLLPPQVQAMEAQETGDDGAQGMIPPPQPQPDPAAQAQAAAEEQKMQIEGAMGALDIELKKLDLEKARLDIIEKRQKISAQAEQSDLAARLSVIERALMGEQQAA